MSKTLGWVASSKGAERGGREKNGERGREGERKAEREGECAKKIGNQIMKMAQSTLTDNYINKMCYIHKRNITQPLQVIKC